jgi:hypothetical protein
MGAVLAFAGRGEAGPILSGSVSYNPATKLYTYRYVLDNRRGTSAINQLSILTDSSPVFWPPFPPVLPSAPIQPIWRHGAFQPVAHTDPSSWVFQVAHSGGSALPPVRESGTFWAWDSLDGRKPGAVLQGFSFTTSIHPTAASANNYFLFSSSFVGGPGTNSGIVEWGHVVAPDLAHAPEPATLVLVAWGVIGLCVLGSGGRRRQGVPRLKG